MTIRDEPIRSVLLKNAVHTGIEYSLYYEGLEAAVSAKLDLWKWDQGGYPKEFMCRVIARHRMNNLIKAHESEAVNAASKKDMKK